ncbi:hypothetical protein [Mucilaginibacter dorajii]|uniref:Lipoprotein n=1 Tax=Mucilaginibacter dorajii TaxID=692994 RepID=A0ABP7QW23_9SPHI|nr:hypothetical protein [Mucilaginibacter dorajii]MCS3732508.1 hypothetical protein [Mucilaginibacter dorajii]
MKKQFLFSALIAGLFMASCSKDNSNTPTAVATKFTFRGKAYTSKGLYSTSSTTVDAVVDSAIADDNSTKLIVNFIFKKGTAGAGTYAIIGDSDATPTDNQVGLLVFETDLKNTKNVGLYTSLSGGSAVLSGSGNTFALKITQVNLKGNYYDNTDPKNTQITEVSTSISAATFTRN